MESRRRHNKGSVLVIVLWTLFLLTTFAVQMGVIVRQKMTLMHRLDTQDKLLFIAEAGVKKAIAALRKEDQLPEADALYESWGNDVLNFHDIKVDGGYFNVYYDYGQGPSPERRFGACDEGSKININTADVDTLTRLMRMVSGLDEEAVTQLAYAIIDWRDADSYYQHPQYGAEDEDYRGLKSPYEAKDGDFEIPEELLLVKGMTAQIFEELKNFVTVYGSGQVNINTAPASVLELLGLEKKIAEDVIAFRKGVDMAEGTSDDNVFMDPSEVAAKVAQFASLADTETATLAKFTDQGYLSVKSDYFRIQSSANLDAGDQVFEIVAVVDRNGHIHYWREYF